MLRYREIIEENKKRDFGVALNHLRHEEESLEKIDETIDSHEKLIEQSGQGAVSARDLQNKFNYARQLDKKRDSQEQNIDKAEKEVETRRGDLIESTKKKKIFERLKERDQESHEKAVRKEEQAHSDEISPQRFKNNGKK